MPTHQSWLTTNIVMTTWTRPLTETDLDTAFGYLSEQLDSTDETIHILFDITDSGRIPASAPVLALRSRFLQKNNTGCVVVIGTDEIGPQILARIASRVSRKDITFFPDTEQAVAYLIEHSQLEMPGQLEMA